MCTIPTPPARLQRSTTNHNSAHNTVITMTKWEAEECSAKKYHTKCHIEKDVVPVAAKQALEAKAKNGGRMPNRWYTNYMAELKPTVVGCHMVIATEDI